MTVEGLSVYEASQAPSEWTKTALEGEDFCHFRANIGMNWQGEGGYCLPEPEIISLVCEKVIKMVKTLCMSWGTMKHSQLLACVGCWEVL